MHIVGIFSSPELAVAQVQREHNEHDYTSWGLRDFRLYELELDKQDAKGIYDDYKTFKFLPDNTERMVALDG